MFLKHTFIHKAIYYSSKQTQQGLVIPCFPYKAVKTQPLRAHEHVTGDGNCHANTSSLITYRVFLFLLCYYNNIFFTVLVKFPVTLQWHFSKEADMLAYLRGWLSLMWRHFYFLWKWGSDLLLLIGGRKRCGFFLTPGKWFIFSE